MKIGVKKLRAVRIEVQYFDLNCAIFVAFSSKFALFNLNVPVKYIFITNKA